MTHVIAHLSDLHFGRIDPPILNPLVAALNTLKPDLIAVSGDLTQRARRVEFKDARAFLDRLPGPQIVVPGNHDVPLRNPFHRFVSKWARFREHIHDDPGRADLSQSFLNAEIAAIGINTARALTWKGGRISADQVEQVRLFFDSAPAEALKILVAHHPLDVPLEWSRGNQARRSRRALDQWSGCGVDLILAGHAHRAFAGAEAAKLRLANHDAVIVQAGTATSTRGRGEPNSFNIIHVSRDQIVVLRQTWQLGAQRFVETHRDTFMRL